MIEETPLQKTLKEILASKSYEKLEHFSDQHSWSTMNVDERELLAQLFLQAAESELKHCASEEALLYVKKLFNNASLISPSNPQIWYRRGCAFMERDDLTSLEEASLCFEKAVSFDKEYFDAWYAWAGVLMHRAGRVSDVEYVLQAKEKFEQATPLLNKSLESSSSAFFWHYGLVWFTLGRFSGEASDFYEALLLFRKARTLGLARREFFHDFGNVLVAFSVLINNKEMILEAIDWYLLSIDFEQEERESDREIASRYCNVGSCYQYLFEKTMNETYFEQALNAFRNSLQHDSQNFNAWFLWGILELFAAKAWQSVEHLECSINMFKRSHELGGDHPLLLARWSEAKSLLGFHEENLEWLYEADALAKKALEIAPNTVESLFAQALAFYQLGRYFSEKSYFLQCCVQAEKGLSLFQDNGYLWHILAVAKFSLSESVDSENDRQLLEEALFCFQKASETTLCRMSCFWNDWGVALLSAAELSNEQKHVQEAIEKFEQAIIQQDPTNSEGLVHYANALDLLGDLTDDEEAYEKAIQILTHVLANDPDNTAARYQLALAWNHFGELTTDLIAYQKAMQELQKVVQLDPEDDQAWTDLGLACMHVARMLLESHDESVRNALYEIAKQNFMRAFYLGNQLVYYHLACLHTLRKEYQEAISFLERAFENELLPSVEEMMEDEWLEPLIHTTHFQLFLDRLANN